jgi:hypothetical protein
MLLSNTWARLLCNFLAYLYPAYMTFKAVKMGDKNAHAQWLTYWIANSYFTVAEIIGDHILSGLPLYFEIKVALLIWLVTPKFRGAEKIYLQVIHPYLVKYESDIDTSLNSLKEQGLEHIGTIKEAGLKHIRAGSNDFLKIGQQAVLNGLLSAAVQGNATENTTTRRKRGNSTTAQQDAPEVD